MTGTDRADDRPRPRRPAHPHASPATARPASTAILDHVERRTDLDVIAITDHERIDAAVAARAMARDRGLRARGRRRRGGHDARRPPAGAVPRPADPAVPLAARDDRGRPRGGRPGHPGPSARPVPAVRPGLGAPPAARRPGPGAPTPTRSRRSTRRPRPAVAPPRRPLRRRARPGPRRQQRRPCARRRSAPAGRPSRAATPPTCGARSRRGTTEHGGTFHADRRPARDVRAAAAQARPRRPRRGRRPGPPRRHRSRPRLPGRPAAAAAVRAPAGARRRGDGGAP